MQARFEELDGYSLEGRAQDVLAGLGFSSEMVEGDVGHSGRRTPAASGRTPMADAPARRPRRDAQRNRAAILEAARATYVDRFGMSFSALCLLITNGLNLTSFVVAALVVNLGAACLQDFNHNQKRHEFSV